MCHSNSLYFTWILCVLCVTFIVSGSFIPKDSFLIDCGGSKSLKLDDGRVFEPDSGNQYVGLSPNSHVVVSENKMGNSNEAILYNSARVFKETSTYTIDTKQIGRHWLRLHFCPVENPHYDFKSAVFSVVANGIVLLHGFTFSKPGKNSCLFKEYVIEVGGSSSEKLVLTLSPWNGSIAFINGIEVVSVPDGQFPTSAVPVPFGPAIEIPTHVAFETAYRINMGGPLLTPKNDSQWRIWEPDQYFLVNAATARNVTINPSLVKYLDGVSVEIAPNWVYATAQEMADANVSDQRFNISWAFEVEPMFTYLIRMHFCDIVSTSLNNLVFNVYINNQSALDSFDISSKTMEMSAAYFIDFVTNVSVVSNRILVQVGPSNLRDFPTNAILNGLEIMKMSNPNDSLDRKLRPDYIDSKTPKRKKWLLLAVISSIAFVVLVLISAAFYLYLRHPKKPRRHSSVWLPLATHVGNSDSKVSVGSFASTAQSLSLSRVLAFSEIRESTKNFDERLVLGVGGFGKVYKAINPSLPREQVNIAEWAMNWQKRGQLEKIIDPHLVGFVNLESLRKFGETAEKCLAEYGTERPTMGDVLWNLEYALQLQEASIQMVSAENSANHIPDIPEWVPQIEPAEGDGADSIIYRESDTATSSGVFSQINDPRGR
ncbi:receptor-like protein kinase THESEUS 1 isoform X1 [Fagus crenata]